MRFHSRSHPVTAATRIASAVALAFGLAGGAMAADPGPNALGFVQNETPGSVPNGDYDIDYNAYAADPSQFLAFSPSVAIGVGATLTFKVFVGDEHGPGSNPADFDQFSVWASPDGVNLGYNVLASSSPSLGGVSIPEWGGVAQYETVTVDLGSFAGQSIHFAFSFDPLDDVDNSHPGVRVDDIRVAQGATELYAENFDSGEAQGYALNGLWHVTGNFPVAAVPEPETYAMLLAGLGLLGWVNRRRPR